MAGVENKSTVAKRSIVVGGHKTSVSLESEFWEVFREMAQANRQTLSEAAAKIDGTRTTGNLSSAIRLSVLDHCRRQYAAMTKQVGQA